MVMAPNRGKMHANLHTTRPAAVAGQFYPADPERLRAQVQRLLAAASSCSDFVPKALIAPHAGYVYSGSVAAEAFAALRRIADTITLVVLIGPAHYVSIAGIAVPAAQEFETPLGRVAVDVDTINRLTDLPVVVRSDAPHAPEHALEVELPFLQVMLPSFKVVPIVVGDAAPRDVATALDKVWGGQGTLIVVSSDLSHYLNYEAARRMDSATAAAIERGDWAVLGPHQACGYLAVAGLLIETERRGLMAQRLALLNSGDTAGPHDQVVGYGAWMFC